MIEYLLKQCLLIPASLYDCINRRHVVDAAIIQKYLFKYWQFFERLFYEVFAHLGPLETRTILTPITADDGDHCTVRTWTVLATTPNVKV